ncbi:tyrosine-type recombinase/integrase [Acinetobacter sp. CUI P1]|nr:tyrosine-type recombinase/integrase [Acinetobacter sp. CUI P1]
MSIYKQEEFEKYLIKSDLTEATVYTYLVEIRKFMSWFQQVYPKTEYFNINQEIIKGYLKNQEIDQKAVTTIDKKISIIKKYFDFLWMNNYLAGYDPSVKIKRKGKRSDREYLTEPEINQLISLLEMIATRDDDIITKRMRALTYLYMYTGLQMKEGGCLLRTDILPIENGFQIIIRVGSQRIVEITGVYAEPLDEYLTLLNQNEKYVFPGRGGGHLQPKSIHLIFQDLSNKMGGIPILPRKLRNTYAVMQYKSGVSIERIAANMGVNQLQLPQEILALNISQ